MSRRVAIVSTIHHALFAALALLALTGPASAAPPDWHTAPPLSVDPARLLEVAAAAPDPAALEGVDTEILLFQLTVTLEADGRETHAWHTISRVLTPAGVQGSATIGGYWAPWFQERAEVRARVVTPDGVTHVLDPATLTEAGVGADSPDVLTDRKRLFGPLPAVAPGAVVESLVVTRDHRPFSRSGATGAFYFASQDPVRVMRFVVAADPKVKPRFVLDALKLKPKTATVDGRRVTTFEMRGVAAERVFEPNTPWDSVRWPRVAYSTVKGWADVAAEYTAIVEAQLEGHALDAMAAEAVAGAATRDEKVARLLALVQDKVRYTGLEFGEAAIVPRKPAETLARRYGDCKDKATLLVGLLRAVGVDAHVTLIRVGDSREVRDDLPGLDQFDHAIVFVPGPEPLWVDPTWEAAAAGQLPASDQGRLVLVAAPTTKGLIQTPVAAAQANRIIETREVRLSPDGPAAVVEASEYTGVPALGLRGQYATANAERLRAHLESYAKETYDAVRLTDLRFTDPKQVQDPMTLTLEVADAGVAWTSQREASVALRHLRVYRGLPEILTHPQAAPLGTRVPERADQAWAKRTHDVQVEHPFVSEIRYRIVPPPGYKARPVPEPRDWDVGPAARLTERYALEPDGAVSATIAFTLNQRRLTPAEARALWAGIQGFDKANAAVMTFDHEAALHEAAGRVREAVDVLERLVTLPASEAPSRNFLIETMMRYGLGEAAREQAKALVAKRPEDADAWRALGWTLGHDLVGRWLERGWDRPGAMAAFLKVVQLDPEDALAHVRVAVAHEHDASGTRWGPGTDLETALTHWKRAAELGQEAEHQTAWLETLFMAGRAAEVEPIARSLPTVSERFPLRVAAVAAADGAEAATRLATRLAGNPQDRQNTLGSAALWLATAGRFTEAAQLLDAQQKLGRGGDDSFLTTMRSARRWLPSTVGKVTEPEHAARLFYASLFEPFPDEATWRPLLAKSQSGVFAASAGRRRKLAAVHAGRLSSVPLSMQALGDLVASSLTLKVDGDADTGWRVYSEDDDADGLVVYVVREDGQARVLTTNDDLRPLAAEAVRQLDRKRPAAARRWLGWLRGHVADPDPANPLSADPVAHLWPVEAADDARVRLAVATYLARGEGAAPHRAVIERARKAAKGLEAQVLDLVLAHSYLDAKRPDLANAAFERLAEARPDDPVVAGLHALKLFERGDDAGAGKLLDAGLAKAPKHPFLTHLAATLAGSVRDYDRARGLYERGATAANATVTALNDAAWLALFGGDLDVALTRATRAVDQAPSRRVSLLHTLACLQAERGDLAAAHERLVEIAGTYADGQVRQDDWWILGRIAEHMGLEDAARMYYARIAKPTYGEGLSTWALAQRRLQAMGARR